MLQIWLYKFNNKRLERFMSEFYQELCNMLIRPTRQIYHLYDLGTSFSNLKETPSSLNMENDKIFKSFLATISKSSAAFTTP